MDIISGGVIGGTDTDLGWTAKVRDVMAIGQVLAVGIVRCIWTGVAKTWPELELTGRR